MNIISGGLGDIIMVIIKSLNQKYLNNSPIDLEIHGNKLDFDENGFMYFDEQFFNKREES